MGVLRDDAIIPRPPEEMMDPIEWVLSPKGLNRNLYPRQATLLKLIFLRDDLFTEYDLEVLGKWAEGFRLVEPGEVPRPDGEDDLIRFESTGALCRGITPDWEDRIRLCKEEGRKWFRETIPIIGRRGSKGYMGGLAGSYVIYDYHGLGDPQGHYGVDRDKKLMAIVFAGKKEQAKINQWQDLVNVLVGSPYFQPWIENSLGESLSIRTPWDNKRVRELTAAGVQTSMDMATFSIVPKESTLMAGRGPTSFCLDPSTPVLTSDLHWVPIKDICEGDEVVGFDEHPESKGSQRKLRSTQVRAVRTVYKKALRLTFDDASEVVCSADHLWLIKEKGRGGGYKWGKAGRLNVGSRIRHLVDPWEVDGSREAGYLAGFFDGEGCVSGWSGRAGASVLISQNSGGVLDYTLDLLRERDITPVRNNVGNCQQWAIGSTAEAMRFLGSIRPIRLMNKQRRVWEGVAPRGGATPSGRERPGGYKTVVSVEHLPEQELVDIETEAHTFIANGLFSHNCQFYDEMAHVIATGANRSAEEVYQAATPSLDQFGVNGFIYTGSSPWQMSGQMYENYLQALSVDPETRLPIRPEMLMLQLFSWDLYTDWDIAHKIEVVPKDCAKDFTSKVYQEVAPPPGWVPDPHRPLFFSMHTKTDDCKDREYERTIRVINPNSSWMAWSSKYGDARLSEYLTQVGGGSSLDLDLPTLWNPIQVPMSAYDRQMQRLERANPDTFRVERLSQWASALNAYLDLRKIEAMFGPWRGRILEMQHQGILGTTYVAHGDPSKSGANFGFAIAHLEGPDENGYMHVVFDHLGAWQPQDYEDATIDYIMVEAEIISLARRFMPSDLTFDQFNSAGMIQRIQMALNQMNLPKRTMVYERTATAPVNWRMAETFKTALNMGLIHAPYFELAELELRFLQLTASQRVDHPTSGPVQTKDVADAMFNVVYHLIGEQMGAFLKQDLAASLPVGSHPGGFPMPADSPLGGARKEDVLSRLSFGSGPLDISRIPRRRR